jgi:hypothetical protein
MKIILTKRDLKKPLKINGQKANEQDRESLLTDLLKYPDLIDEIIITKNTVSVEIKNR